MTIIKALIFSGETPKKAIEDLRCFLADKGRYINMDAKIFDSLFKDWKNDMLTNADYTNDELYNIYYQHYLIALKFSDEYNIYIYQNIDNYYIFRGKKFIIDPSDVKEMLLNTDPILESDFEKFTWYSLPY